MILRTHSISIVYASQTRNILLKKVTIMDTPAVIPAPIKTGLKMSLSSVQIES